MRGNTLVQASFNTIPGEQASPTQEPVAETPSLMVVDQAIRGGTVKIDSAFLEDWGFMTIHNQNAAGAYGPVIGWTPLPKGATEDIIVNIDASKATETMYAMLHIDDDPQGVLEFPGPDEPVMVMGEVIALPFKVTGGLPGSDLEISAAGGDSPHLVDTEGMSLYTSLNDSPGVSNCTGDCQKTWLPLLITTGRLVAGDGISSSKLGVLTLRNGKRQVTYGGLPLYYYIGDKEPGDVLGHGVDGLWFLATP
jgi:predicted lipoprotein with Yx(FWY)xxD motif